MSVQPLSIWNVTNYPEQQSSFYKWPGDWNTNRSLTSFMIFWKLGTFSFSDASDSAWKLQNIMILCHFCRNNTPIYYFEYLWDRIYYHLGSKNNIDAIYPSLMPVCEMTDKWPAGRKNIQGTDNPSAFINPF